MWWWISAAWAQVPGTADYELPELATDTFRPSTDARATWTTEDAAPVPGFSARAQVWYLRSPLVYESFDGTQTNLVEDVLALGVSAAWGTGPLRIGAHLPLYLASDGLGGGHGAAVGDPELALRLNVLSAGPWAFAASLGGTAPLGAADQQLGAPGFTWRATAIGQWERERVTVLANLGARGLPTVSLSDEQTLNDQGIVALAVVYSVDDSLRLAGEVQALPTWSALGAGGVPAEALLGVHWRGPNDRLLRAAIGTGLTSAPGSPKVRLVVGVGQDGVRDGSPLLER